MRYGTLGQSGGAVATAEQSGGGAAAAGVKEIPYDYVATFKLTGKRGTRVQDVINISTEGTFSRIGWQQLRAAKALTPSTAPPLRHDLSRALSRHGGRLGSTMPSPTAGFLHDSAASIFSTLSTRQRAGVAKQVRAQHRGVWRG